MLCQPAPGICLGHQEVVQAVHHLDDFLLPEAVNQVFAVLSGIFVQAIQAAVKRLIKQPFCHLLIRHPGIGVGAGGVEIALHQLFAKGVQGDVRPVHQGKAAA